jgi:hypothetical protein
MTIVLLSHGSPAADGCVMTAVDTVTLARLLAEAALIAATTEYAEVVRRLNRRAEARDHAVLSAHGLQGLVRVFLADGQAPEASITPLGQ